MIIFLFYAVLSLFLKVFPDILIKYLQEKVKDFEKEEIEDKIKKYNMNLFIIACIGGGCALLAFITGLTLLCNDKKVRKQKEVNIDEVKDQDLLQGIDYNENEASNRSN